MSASYAIASILDKLLDTQDRDVRFIALKDLQTELHKLHIQTTLNQEANKTQQATLAAAATAATAGHTTNNSISATTTGSSSSTLYVLDISTETKVFSVLLYLMLTCTGGGDVAELSVLCMRLLLSISHTNNLLTFITTLLSYIINPEQAAPTAHATAAAVRGAEQRRGFYYYSQRTSSYQTAAAGLQTDTATTGDDEDETGLSNQVDKRQVCASALLLLFPQLIYPDAIIQAAHKTLPTIMDTIEQHKAKSDTGDIHFTILLLSLMSSYLTAHSRQLTFLHQSILLFAFSLLQKWKNKLQLKAVINVITALAPALHHDLIQRMIQQINTLIHTQRYACYSLISALSINCTQGMLSSASELLSLILKSSSLLQQSKTMTAADVAQNEERETALFALEHLIKHTGVLLLPSFSKVLPLLSDALKHDPNYIGDDDNDDNDDQGAQDEQEEDKQQEEEEHKQNDVDADAEEADEDMSADLSDDDVLEDEDPSNHIRRAAMKCILAMIQTVSTITQLQPASTMPSSTLAVAPRVYLQHRNTVVALTRTLIPLLLSRAHERISHIRIGILVALQQLVGIATTLNIHTDRTVLMEPKAFVKVMDVLLNAARLASKPVKPSPAALDTLSHIYAFLSVIIAAYPVNSFSSSVVQKIVSTVFKVSPDVEKASGVGTDAVLISIWQLLATLMARVTAVDQWLSTAPTVQNKLLIAMQSPLPYQVLNEVLLATQQWITLCSRELSMPPAIATKNDLYSIPLFPMPINSLDVFCEVDTEQDRQADFDGETVSKLFLLLDASIDKLLPAIIALINDKRGGTDKSTKNAAIHTLGWMYARLMISRLKLDPHCTTNEVSPWPCLVKTVDNPLTRTETCRAIARMLRTSSLFLTCLPAPPPLNVAIIVHYSIITSLVSCLTQRDRTLQHYAMAALNTLALRLIHELRDTPEVQTGMGPSLSQLWSAITPILTCLSLHSDWVHELRWLCTLLSHILYAVLHSDAHKVTATQLFINTIHPALFALIQSLPEAQLTFPVATSIAAIYALVNHAVPAIIPLESLYNSSLSAVKSSSSTTPQHRAIAMIVAASVCSSITQRLPWKLADQLEKRVFRRQEKEEPPPLDESKSRAINQYIQALIQKATSLPSINTNTSTSASATAPASASSSAASSDTTPNSLSIADALFATQVLGELAACTAIHPDPHGQLLLSAFDAVRTTDTPNPSPELITLCIAHCVTIMQVVIHNTAEWKQLFLDHLAHVREERQEDDEVPTGIIDAVVHMYHTLLNSMAEEEQVGPEMNSASGFIVTIDNQALLQDTFTYFIKRIHPGKVGEITAQAAQDGLALICFIVPRVGMGLLGQGLDVATQETQPAAVQESLPALIFIILNRAIVRYHTAGHPDRGIEHSFDGQLALLLPRLIDYLTAKILVLRADTINFIKSLCQCLPNVLTPVLPKFFEAFSRFCTVDQQFVETRRYGPITKHVDTAVPVRSDGWELIELIVDKVSFSPEWYGCSQSSSAERSMLLHGVTTSLLHGLQDEVEVRLMLFPAFDALLQIVALSVSDLLPLLRSLQHCIDSTPATDAINAQIQQHEQMLRAAVKTATVVVKMLEDGNSAQHADCQSLQESINKKQQQLPALAVLRS